MQAGLEGEDKEGDLVDDLQHVEQRRVHACFYCRGRVGHGVLFACVGRHGRRSLSVCLLARALSLAA